MSDSRACQIARALVDLTAEQGDGDINAYLEHHLVDHVGQGDLWDDLGSLGRVVDRLDIEGLRGAVLKYLFGRGPIPVAIAATVHAAHLAGTTLDRASVRLLGQARLTGRSAPNTEQPPTQIAWSRRWRRDPLSVPLTGHTDTVTGVAAVMLPDGRVLLATTSYDETVRLWDPATGAPVGDPLTGHTDTVTGVAAVTLPDRRVLLATTSHDRTVRLWDPATGAPVGDPLTGHTNEVSGVAAVTLPDRRVLLATTSHDQTVRLWDLDTRLCVRIFQLIEPGLSLAVVGSALVIATEGGLLLVDLQVVSGDGASPSRAIDL